MFRRAILIFVILNVHLICVKAFSFDVMDPRLKIVRNGAGYKLSMPENNHDSDFWTALFKIYDYDQDADPPYLLDLDFECTVERFLTNWVVYTNTSFDYETDLRYHVINVGIGEHELQTITLLIENIDDEPPVLKCNDLTMIEGYIYNASYSPLRCNITDPDGFLDQITVTVKGENKEIFDFVLPDVIDPLSQTMEVAIVNKVILNSNTTTPFILTVEIKDGAGHSTVPDADIDLSITVQSVDA